MTTPGEMTTFWPMLQRLPMRAPVITWEKCQILVPSPTVLPSSTYDDSCTNTSDMCGRLRMNGQLRCRDAIAADLRRQLHGRPRDVDAEPSTRQHFLVDARVQVGKAF